MGGAESISGASDVQEPQPPDGGCRARAGGDIGNQQRAAKSCQEEREGVVH